MLYWYICSRILWSLCNRVTISFLKIATSGLWFVITIALWAKQQWWNLLGHAVGLELLFQCCYCVFQCWNDLCLWMLMDAALFSSGKTFLVNAIGCRTELSGALSFGYHILSLTCRRPASNLTHDVSVSRYSYSFLFCNFTDASFVMKDFAYYCRFSCVLFHVHSLFVDFRFLNGFHTSTIEAENYAR